MARIGWCHAMLTSYPSINAKIRNDYYLCDHLLGDRDRLLVKQNPKSETFNRQ